MPQHTDISQQSLLRFLPAWAVPYGLLARWDRPVGTWLLYWPCAWSVTLAADQLSWRWAWYVLLFWIGAFLMRGAGCTINDMADRDFDAAVERTRGRPLASGRLRMRQAAAFMMLQAAVALLVVLQFNALTIGLSFASLVIVAAYPFAKRVTYWPQVVLGLAFNWGALVGWTAWTGSLGWPAVLMYAAGIAWTLGYDTIYAHQDKNDDAIVGVKSTALLFGESTVYWMAGFYALTWVLLMASFVSAGVSWWALLAMVVPAAHLVWQITVSRIHDPAQCLKVFKSNVNFGWLVFGCLLLDLVV